MYSTWMLFLVYLFVFKNAVVYLFTVDVCIYVLAYHQQQRRIQADKKIAQTRLLYAWTSDHWPTIERMLVSRESFLLLDQLRG